MGDKFASPGKIGRGGWRKAAGGASSAKHSEISASRGLTNHNLYVMLSASRHRNLRVSVPSTPNRMRQTPHAPPARPRSATRTAPRSRLPRPPVNQSKIMLALTTAALSFNVAVRPSSRWRARCRPQDGPVDDVKNSSPGRPGRRSTHGPARGGDRLHGGAGVHDDDARDLDLGPQVPPARWPRDAGARRARHRRSDDDAALSGLVFTGRGTLLTAAAAAGISAGYTTTIATWNLLCALSCARRSGGLFKRVTELDLGVVDSVLPKDTKVSTRNIVGANVAAWGLICWKFQDFFLGSRIVAGGATPLMTSVILPGIALANLLLSGKIFAGSTRRRHQRRRHPRRLR